MAPKIDTDSAVEIKDLRVDYGDFTAVRDLSLNIPRGEVYGIVGPNGAGKTSTFKVLATLMEPTYGEVRLNGLDLLEQTRDVRKILGYMPDLAPVPSDLKLWEFLAFHAHTHQLGSRKQRMSRVEECLDSVNLTEKRNAWCKKLSRGQTQRLVLAKTMLHRPEILILDEPASGLDPLSRRELRHVLQGFAREGSTVLISSHILSELAEMCSSLCIMNQGEVLAAGKTAHVRRELSHAERTLSLAVIDGQEAASSLLKQHEGVRDIKLVDEKIEFQFHGSDASQAAMLSDIIALGVSVKLLEEKTSSFEDILVQVAEQNSEK